MTTGENWLQTRLTVLPGFGRNEVELGYHSTAALAGVGGTVFEDTDGDGTRGDGEPGLADVQVVLTPASGTPVLAVTRPDGSFLAQVPPGEVTVAVLPASLPGADTRVYDLTAGEDQVGPFEVSTAEAVTGITLGYRPIQPATVAGRVFEDANDNGQYDEGEPGLPGVVVSAVPVGRTGVEAPQATTAEDGTYRLLLAEGSVIVSPDPASLPAAPEGLVYRRAAGGAVSGQSLEATMGATFEGVNFGYASVTAAALVGMIFEDTDGNSLRGPGEPGLAGVTVAAVDEVGRRTAVLTAEDGSYRVPFVPPRAVLEVDETTLPPSAFGYRLTAGAPLLANTFTVAPGSVASGLALGFQPIQGPSGTAGVNPFTDPDPELTSRFGLPATLPEGAGTATVPVTGPWRFSRGAGTLTCDTDTVRQLTPGEQTTITLVPTSDRVTVYNLPDVDGAVIPLNVEPGITGRYRGAVTLSQPEGSVTLNYAIQLVTEDQLIGYLTGDTFVDGERCTLYHTFEAEYTGS